MKKHWKIIPSGKYLADYPSPALSRFKAIYASEEEAIAAADKAVADTNFTFYVACITHEIIPITKITEL